MSFRIFGELQIKQHVLRLLALLFSSLEIRNIMIQSCILLIDFFPAILASLTCPKILPGWDNLGYGYGYS